MPKGNSGLKTRASRLDSHVADLEKQAIAASKVGNRVLANHLMTQAERLSKHSDRLSARDRMENPPKEPVVQERKRFKPSGLGTGQADSQPAMRTDRVPQRPQQPQSIKPKAWSDEARAAALAARQAGHTLARFGRDRHLNQFGHGLDRIMTQVRDSSGKGRTLFHEYVKPSPLRPGEESGIVMDKKGVTDMGQKDVVITEDKAGYASLGPKRGGKFTAVSGSGRVIGTHPTRADAVAQVQAFNLSKRRAEGKPAPPAPKKGWTTLPDGRRVMIADDNDPSNPLVIGGRNPWMIGGQHVGMGGTDRSQEVHAAGPRGNVKPGAGPVPGEQARNVPPSGAALQRDQRGQAARGLQRKYVASRNMLDERNRDLGPETSRGIARLTDGYKPETGSMRPSNRKLDTVVKYAPPVDIGGRRNPRPQETAAARGVAKLRKVSGRRIDARQDSYDHNAIDRDQIVVPSVKDVWDGVVTKERR